MLFCKVLAMCTYPLVIQWRETHKGTENRGNTPVHGASVHRQQGLMSKVGMPFLSSMHMYVYAHVHWRREGPTHLWHQPPPTHTCMNIAGDKGQAAADVLPSPFCSPQGPQSDPYRMSLACCPCSSGNKQAFWHLQCVLQVTGPSIYSSYLQCMWT